MSFVKYCVIFIVFILCSSYCNKQLVPRYEPKLLLSLDVEESDLFDNTRRKSETYFYSPKKLINQLPISPSITRKSILLPNFSRDQIFVYLWNQEQPQTKWYLPKPTDDDVLDSLSLYQNGKDIIEKQSGFINSIAVDDREKYIYYQYSLPTQVARQYTSPIVIDHKLSSKKQRDNTSLIFQINDKGQVTSQIRREQSFQNVLKLWVDKRNFLFVLHQPISRLVNLLVFHDGIFIGEYSEPNIQAQKNARSSFVQIENMWPLVGVALSDYLLPLTNTELLSKKTQIPPIIGVLAFRSKSDYSLIERVIYRQQHPDSEPIVILRTTDFFTYAQPDGQIVLQEHNVAGDTIVYKFYDTKGKFQYRTSVRLQSPRSSWRNFFFDLRGNLYSTRFLKNRYEVYQWES